ncbi:DUF1127 domain-containing protein [Marivita geojedonensis]|uniref:YjiS-like domain-containing protein n=1 Tax=Marivita geojedonensis TaxID=1123756 RepID=A0A1X4NP00_9RHOB|nr:DUF1127 domain-containing protein [Marivita geojedonensis]OSQ52435.1 hypothetical protein MGEO_03355 [Marivita geojedonensis]PRY73738.1 uncharacterized protein DUF1127 [Marivita geojedonensis]
MTLAVTHPAAPMGAITVLRVVDSILSLKAAVVAWNEMRITRKQLLNLSEDQLNDIGLTLSDLR